MPAPSTPPMTERVKPRPERHANSEPVRGLAVTFGLPMMLNLFLGTSVLATAIDFLRQPERMKRWYFRPLITLGALAPWVYLLGIRPWHRYWGATDEEVRRPLPGDALVPHPIGETTRAVTIRAPVADVWPWLVQMGQGRGGLYSYDWLENLAGLNIHSTDRILPECQHLQVGDVVSLGSGSGLNVAMKEPPHALVLHAVNDLHTGLPVDLNDPTTEQYLNWSWAFILDERDEQTTRLIIRARADARPRRWAAEANTLFVEVPHFVMERKMLLGIKQRAEKTIEEARTHAVSGRDSGA